MVGKIDIRKLTVEGRKLLGGLVMRLRKQPWMGAALAEAIGVHPRVKAEGGGYLLG